MLEAFIAVLVGVAAAQASPGPNLVAVVSVALGQGRVAALLVTLGISSGMLVWAIFMALGLGALITRYPLSLTFLKFVGGGYLLWLSTRALMAAWHGKATTIQTDTNARTYTAHWKHGVFVVLTNPKAALMWAAVATFLFGANLTALQVAVFGPIGAISGFIIYGSYACLFSTNSANALYKRFSRWVELLFGVSFGALGGKLILAGSADLRG